jgi:hypothetical protein
MKPLKVIIDAKVNTIRVCNNGDGVPVEANMEPESLETAMEKAIRSRWLSGLRDTARQMSRIVWGFCSDLRRESADRVFCLEVRGVVEFGERIEEALERWWWRVSEAEVREEGFGEGSGEDEREEEREKMNKDIK